MKMTLTSLSCLAALVLPATALAQGAPSIGREAPAADAPAAAPADASAPAAPAKAPPAAKAAPAAKGVKVPAPVKVSEEERRAVRAHPMVQRLSTVAARPRFAGAAKGSWRWTEQAMGKGTRLVPVAMATPRGLLQAYSTRDGKKLWITAAMLRDPATILRLGDLLPLLKAVGVEDRDAAIAVTQVQVGSGSPPTYSLSFRPGVLWQHRAALAAQQEKGRLLYSLTTGRLVVLGAFVFADAKGDLQVRLTDPTGDQLERITTTITPRGCRDMEKALQSEKPASAAALAAKKLAEPSMTQACAARYLALSGVKTAPDTLRRALKKNKLARPAEVVEALATIAPEPDAKNIEAALAMMKRLGTLGTDAVCKGAPLSWTDKLLARDDLDESMRAVLTRCAWH